MDSAPPLPKLTHDYLIAPPPHLFQQFYSNLALLFSWAWKGQFRRTDGCIFLWLGITWNYLHAKKGTISETNCWIGPPKQREKGGCGQSGAGLPTCNISVSGCSTAGTTAEG
ncbi:Hypothetical predicted protein [Xyrichtys novacula]|uniref:Uncharacterized protein n=1 Tax=Xyrichtys novacula TaxID=13765 RepID=A0AAV1FZE9_XYRNO|nr:Hypothetical predicted protein [Xyrichtys novacula]